MEDLGNRNDQHTGDQSPERLAGDSVLVLEPGADGRHTAIGPADAVEGPMKAVNLKPEGQLRPPLGIVAGSLFGLASAVLYTLANIALRHCVAMDPFLVSAVKAAPTVLILGPFLGWMIARGETVATSRRMVPRFMGAALVGQFLGNACFQISLGMIGLAIAVPITLGMMIVGAAVLGRVVLHEPVRIRTALAMLVLIASVVVLSLPSASDPNGTVMSVSEANARSSQVLMGSLCAALSGAAYALFGVVMRQALTGGLSAPLTMFISGAVGTLSLWSATFLRLGYESISQVANGDWAIMFGAGLLNFTAFVALAASLKSLPVVAVNLINASQVAMAAVAGIILFNEPVTGTLILGIALTMIGLCILADRRRRPREPSKPVEQPSLAENRSVLAE